MLGEIALPLVVFVLGVLILAIAAPRNPPPNAVVPETGRAALWVGLFWMVCIAAHHYVRL